MDRRWFCAWIAAVPFAARLTHAQGEKVKFVGFLSPNQEATRRHRDFRDDLQKLGWVEGKNLRIEFRFGGGSGERLAALADELVKLKPDVIVGQSTPSVAALKNATREIPIVMGNAADPVGSGFVTNLARPGGNITGVSMMLPELAGKRLELLRDWLPKLTRVAFLGYGPDPAHKQFTEQTRDAGKRLGMQVQVLIVHKAEELESAFTEMAKQKAEAVVVQPLFANTLGLGPRIAELALKHKLPSISDGGGFADQGGLLFYGPDVRATNPRVALYVDRILRGAKPSDLPIEQPQKFEFVVNLKTARAIGAEPPRGMLLKVDRLVE
jgi:putative tryptophan/tyrosine transport system substrate-binding protein